MGELTGVFVALAMLLTGAALGALALWFAMRGRAAQAAVAARAEAEIERALLAEKLRAADADRSRLQAAGEVSRAEGQAQQRELTDKLDGARTAIAELRERNGTLAAQWQAERDHAAEKLAVLTDARGILTSQFQNLASEILEEKARRFTEQNQSNLGRLLDPLRERIKEFQSRVEDVYVNETRDRGALAEQVKQLLSLNHALSDDARNLTAALKGSSKAQGSWGEVVLERILESAGLRAGHEYEVQASHARADGSRARPDVVIRLPGDRYVVVDAKVSLTAYEAYVSGTDDVARAQALARHCDSVRNHMRGLALRDYQDLYGAKSFDCVLMFVAIEPAFILAIAEDDSLFTDAWEKNVLLASPSTLLFAVRTIAHLWRQEAQSANAQEIARRGGLLYDRLAAFVEDLERVGERLQQAQDSYLSARDRLSRTKGNVIRQAQMLRELGVKPNRTMPASLPRAADDEEDENEDGDGCGDCPVLANPVLGNPGLGTPGLGNPVLGNPGLGTRTEHRGDGAAPPARMVGATPRDNAP